MSQTSDNAATASSATPYGTFPPSSASSARKPISLPRLREMHTQGEKIVMLTAYDATFAAVADSAGVECILVGDSLGMVCQGLSSTVGVTLETMRHHTECVANGLRRAHGTAWLIGDLPFGTYHESKEQALRSAAVLMQAGAHMVKLEGGGWTTETVRFLVERGIPVCAHLGLTPQTVHALPEPGRTPGSGGAVKGLACPRRSRQSHHGGRSASAGSPGHASTGQARLEARLPHRAPPRRPDAAARRCQRATGGTGCRQAGQYAVD